MRMSCLLHRLVLLFISGTRERGEKANVMIKYTDTLGYYFGGKRKSERERGMGRMMRSSNRDRNNNTFGSGPWPLG